MKRLRVAHYPQIPCESFIVEVEDLKEAKKIKDILANYDLFQYDNKIKSDYANMTIVEEFDEAEKCWESWLDDETGINDIDEYFEQSED